MTARALNVWKGAATGVSLKNLKNDANRATDVAPCKYPIRYTELLVDVVRISYALVHMHMAYNGNRLEKKSQKRKSCVAIISFRCN